MGPASPSRATSTRRSRFCHDPLVPRIEHSGPNAPSACPGYVFRIRNYAKFRALAIRINQSRDRDEAISVPEGTFSRQHGGTWKKNPANIGAVLKKDHYPKLFGRIRKDLSPRFVGAQPLDDPTNSFPAVLSHAVAKVNQSDFTSGHAHVIDRFFTEKRAMAQR